MAGNKMISSQELAERKRRAALILKRLKKLIPDAKLALHYSNPWELLVAVVLSAQCTDKKVNEVAEKLFKKYRKLDDYVEADLHEFENDIRQTGFYHNKAKHILTAAKIVKERFNGRVPKTMEEIIKLPGVARKTANIVLGEAYGVIEGIAVDTHVRRLSKQLGLTHESDPVKIERDLMAIIPKKDWLKTNYLLVEYGRRYCPAKLHNHAACPLNKVK
ncbi:endonuclease III [Patescibacteria group bacterium]|nr:endonuclease III [Patescibacteria group bacterium]